MVDSFTDYQSTHPRFLGETPRTTQISKSFGGKEIRHRISSSTFHITRYTRKSPKGDDLSCIALVGKGLALLGQKIFLVHFFIVNFTSPGDARFLVGLGMQESAFLVSFSILTSPSDENFFIFLNLFFVVGVVSICYVAALYISLTKNTIFLTEKSLFLVFFFARDEKLCG